MSDPIDDAEAAAAAWKRDNPREHNLLGSANINKHHARRLSGERTSYLNGYRARAAESKPASPEPPHCWHCLVALEPEPPARCESCPVECDDENCTAEGCVRERAANPGVVSAGRMKPQVTLAEAHQGMATPWPMRDCLERLADFAHDRLVNHDYDGAHWELLQRAKDKAREYLANWPESQASSHGAFVPKTRDPLTGDKIYLRAEPQAEPQRAETDWREYINTNPSMGYRPTLANIRSVFFAGRASIRAAEPRAAELKPQPTAYRKTTDLDITKTGLRLTVPMSAADAEWLANGADLYVTVHRVSGMAIVEVVLDAIPEVEKVKPKPTNAELIAMVRRNIPAIALTPPAFEALEALSELERRLVKP